MRNEKKTLTLFWVIMVLFATACANSPNASSSGTTKPPQTFVYNNQLFRDTRLVSAAVSSLAGGAPNFSWPALSDPHIVAAVFDTNIQVSAKERRVINPEHIVWLWHSGLNNGRDGNVRYSDGYDPRGLGFDVENPPEPAALPPGSYVWAVWSMDGAGNVVASSQELLFSVP